MLAGFVLRRHVVCQDDINPNRLDARTTAFRHVTKEEIARFELERENSRLLLRLSLTVMFFREKNQILLSCKEITLTNSLKDER